MMLVQATNWGQSIQPPAQFSPFSAPAATTIQGKIHAVFLFFPPPPSLGSDGSEALIILWVCLIICFNHIMCFLETTLTLKKGPGEA